LALIGGLVSLLLAVASGFIAYLTARANFKRELQRIREQINVQKEVERREQIAVLKQEYLAPLRYYAQMLSLRFDELKNKFTSKEDQRVRNWFKQIKDHVARDHKMDQDYGTWCCYEGVFSVSTIYYTFCYFQCARELMAHVPFREIRPSYSVELEKQLAKVRTASGTMANTESGSRCRKSSGIRFRHVQGQQNAIPNRHGCEEHRS
jgi:hypothetical protein